MGAHAIKNIDTTITEISLIDTYQDINNRFKITTTHGDFCASYNQRQYLQADQTVNITYQEDGLTIPTIIEIFIL